MWEFWLDKISDFLQMWAFLTKLDYIWSIDSNIPRPLTPYANKSVFNATSATWRLPQTLTRHLKENQNYSMRARAHAPMLSLLFRLLFPLNFMMILPTESVHTHKLAPAYFMYGRLRCCLHARCKVMKTDCFLAQTHSRPHITDGKCKCLEGKQLNTRSLEC